MCSIGETSLLFLCRISTLNACLAERASEFLASQNPIKVGLCHRLWLTSTDKNPRSDVLKASSGSSLLQHWCLLLVGKTPKLGVLLKLIDECHELFKSSILIISNVWYFQIGLIIGWSKVGITVAMGEHLGQPFVDKVL